MTKPACGRALNTWANFLMGKRSDPGEFEQHVVLVGELSYAEGMPVSPLLNRYFLRTAGRSLITHPGTLATYAKLGRIIIIGFMAVTKRSEWKGTKLHVREGEMGGPELRNLPSFLPHYWNAAADRLGEALSSMSQRQVAKVDQVFNNSDLDAMAASDSFRAMHADVEMSGSIAFSATGRGSRKE